MKNPIEFAHQFSEGNKALEYLLLYCFNNGIMTRGCCAGHKGVFNPNIYFDLNKDQVFLASSIFENVLKNKLGSHCDFHIFLGDNDNYLVSCHIDDIKYNSIFFETIHETIKRNINTKNKSNYNCIFDILNNMKDVENFDSNFEIKSNGDINYLVYKLTYIKELDCEMKKGLNCINGDFLVNYFNNLDDINGYDEDDLNNSYTFNYSNIEQLTRVMNNAKERVNNPKISK